MSDDDILKEAQEAFRLCDEAERENRAAARDDIRFARLGEQWDEALKQQRLRDGRPMLTINKLPPFIRQVVNDARQNKPQIRVLPQDSKADPDTAEVMSGLIRNIESSSDADTAYDTALEHAATAGVGYFRINTAYACDDSWDQDIVFERVANPFTVYGDPQSQAADSSDWNVAFVTEMTAKKDFERRFKGAAQIDWSACDMPTSWQEGEEIMLAEYWVRSQVSRAIVLCSDGVVRGLAEYEAEQQRFLAAGVTVVGQPRSVMSYEVKQHLLSGIEVLEKVDWAGKYIPIVPVYGDEVNLDGKRYFRSLIRDAKDAQIMHNAWRTASTELVALAPKAPFVGPEEAFQGEDADKWENANTETYAFLSYKGAVPPQRQPFAGPAAGALQEALLAADDMKSIIGIYDASLGARSNETSGRAIMARQREGDISTFHFIDNLSRAIRHAGRILIDLIPKVYDSERVIRVLGQDPADVKTVPLKRPVPVTDKRGQPAVDPASGQPMMRIYDLGIGKYDLTVSSGPSFTTRREEAAVQMTELIRAYPAAAPLIGDLLAKNLDWPGADEIAERMEAMLPPQVKGQNPEMAQVQQAMQQMQAQIAQLSQQLQAEKTDKALEAEKLKIDAFRAETERLKASHEIQQPTALPRMPEAA